MLKGCYRVCYEHDFGHLMGIFARLTFSGSDSIYTMSLDSATSDLFIILSLVSSRHLKLASTRDRDTYYEAQLSVMEGQHSVVEKDKCPFVELDMNFMVCM
jgi:hypothetical protein